MSSPLPTTQPRAGPWGECRVPARFQAHRKAPENSCGFLKEQHVGRKRRRGRVRVGGGIQRNVGAVARASLPASSLHSFPGPLFPESPPPPDTRAEFSSLTRSLLPPQGRALRGRLSKSWECSVRLEQESCREKGSGKDKGPGAAWCGSLNSYRKWLVPGGWDEAKRPGSLRRSTPWPSPQSTSWAEREGGES